MPRKTKRGEKYFDEEDVIASFGKYHRVSCKIVELIQPWNPKRLRSWKDAVALNLVACRICKPYSEPASTNAAASEQST